MSRPWDAARERKLTIAKDILFYLVLGAFASALGAGVRGHWPLAGWLILVMMAVMIADLAVMEKIKEMAPNKPAGDVKRMTRWRFWAHDTVDFVCDCGTGLTFLTGLHGTGSAQWSPNEGRSGSDPGGGRWCLKCPVCERGHYKFNVDPRSDSRGDFQ